MTTSPPHNDESVYTPLEQLPIAFFDDAVLAVRREDGQIYVSIRDMCEALELAFTAQRRRIFATDRLREAVARFRVQTAGGRQVADFLTLEMIPVWLLSVQPRRTSDTIRVKLTHVQDYLVRSVQAAFAQLTGLPDAPSREIEDLRDLDRIDTALRQLQSLSERQEHIDQSQDRARLAWKSLADQVRALTERVQQLEHMTNTRMSPAQRNTIYRMVHIWGTARAARDSKLSVGAAIHACWAIVNIRFKVATYTDLPAARYDECCSYIQQVYLELTGEQLSIIEQEDLGI